MSTTATNLNGLVLADGRYRITRILGEGGMGIAYLGWDNRLETEIVLKVPHRHLLTNPEVVKRFTREIRSLVALSNPHIVRVTDVVELEGMPVSVMQYLAGGSLDDRLKELSRGSTRDRCEAVIAWLDPIAAALDFVHQNGFVHRDIKPANILFDGHGNSYLADFGVAKALADQQDSKQTSALTGTGMVLGTPDYMAPEMITTGTCDGRADQYALAITAFEVLSGRLPITAPSATAMLVAHATQRPSRLGDFLPGMPQAVTDALDRGMAKDPAKRFANCCELAQSVTRVLIATLQDPALAAQLDTVSLPMTPVSLACPSCQKSLKATAEYRGKKVTCPACRTPLLVSQDLTRLEIATAGQGSRTTAQHIPSPMTATAPQARPSSGSLPQPTGAIIRPTQAEMSPPIPSVTRSQSLPESQSAAEGNSSSLIWGIIGAAAGVIVLAIAYMFFMRSDESAPKVVENTTPPTTPVTTPVEVKPAPPINTPPATTQPIQPPADSNSPPVTTPVKVSTPPPRPAPTQPTQQPRPAPTTPQVAAKISTPAPTPPPVAPKPVVAANPLAALPDSIGLPPLPKQGEVESLTIGKLPLNAGDTLNLSLLTEIVGVKAKKKVVAAEDEPPAALNAIRMPTKREWKLQIDLVAGTKDSWEVAADPVANPQADADEKTKAVRTIVGRFMLQNGGLTFSWNPQIDAVISSLLRNAVLQLSVGGVERKLPLRAPIKMQAVKLDLNKKQFTVPFGETYGLPPAEGLVLEVLNAEGLPSGTQYNPPDRIAQNRRLQAIINPANPEVRLDFDLNHSASSGALRVEPVYVIGKGQEFDFTTDRIGKLTTTLEGNILAKERQIGGLDGELNALGRDRDRVIDLLNNAEQNEKNKFNAQLVGINGRMASRRTIRNTAFSELNMLNVQRTVLPQLQEMIKIHLAASLKFRVYYVVGDTLVELVRAE